jgi:hypothetical protein
MSIVFFLCMDLFLKRGFRDIKDQFVSIQLDDRWRVAINGKRVEHNRVPPYHVLLECNGLPVTLVGPQGGGPIIGMSEGGLLALLKKFGAELPPDAEAQPEPEAQLELPMGTES